MVIRLCTNEKKVTEFYNQIDEVLEFNLEVLDDYLDEAKEVHRHNKWLNYALPMHRCRELGYHDRLFDLLGACDWEQCDWRVSFWLSTESN